MWMGDSASAMIKLSISWPSDVTFLVVKLKELLETQVLCTVEGTFEEISLANLAMRLNAPPSDLIPREYKCNDMPSAPRLLHAHIILYDSYFAAIFRVEVAGLDCR